MKKTRTQKDVLLEKFELAMGSDLKFEGDLQSIDFFKTFAKAESKKQMFKILGCNCIMIKCGNDSVLIIFAVPIRSNSEGDENRHVSERLMETVKCVEDCFINLESMNANEVKEDKMIYLTIVKKAEA